MSVIRLYHWYLVSYISVSLSKGLTILQRSSSWKRHVIAITGSAGKTTTKEMIASILRRKYRTFKTEGNQNLPNFILWQKRKISPAHRVLVLEYGMSTAGHIRRSCQIIRPNIGVITTVGTAHIGNFGGSLHRLARAKSELIHGMAPYGKLFLNADNPQSKLLQTRGFKGAIYTVGIHRPAHFRARNIRYGSRGMSFTVKLGHQSHQFYIPVLGRHNIYNALFAIAIGYKLGVPPSLIRQGLLTYQKPERRLVVYRLRRQVKVIDDSFSSNPQAAKAAINVLTTIGKGRRIAVLGSMLELGRYTRRGHRMVGAYAARRKVSDLLTYGPATQHIRAAAIQAGLPRRRARHFLSRPALHRHLGRIVTPYSTVLVKGSYKMNMHKTVAFLRRRG